MASTENLSKLISQKLQVLTQLRQVGLRQGQLVAAGDVAALLKLLGAKQQLLAGLQKLERAMAPYHDQDPELRVWASPDHRAACAAEATQCKTLLAEIVAMEREHEQAMVVRRDEVAEQLRHAQSAQAATSAYTSNSSAHNASATPPKPMGPTLSEQSPRQPSGYAPLETPSTDHLGFVSEA